MQIISWLRDKWWTCRLPADVKGQMKHEIELQLFMEDGVTKRCPLIVFAGIQCCYSKDHEGFHGIRRSDAPVKGTLFATLSPR